MTRMGYLILAVVLVAWPRGSVRGQINGSPSPDYEFLTTPANTTVPEGEPAVFKCLVASPSHVCRWYFLEIGLDIFSPHVAPMLVREFTPAHRRDCSIRIKKVRKAQEGQWLCQVLKFQSSKFLMTKPAVLRVITEGESGTWTPPPEPTPPRQGRREPETQDSKDGKTPGKMEFKLKEEDYIQNAELGDSVMLKCQVDRPISECSWVMPHGAFLNLSQDKVESSTPSTHADYRLEGDLNEGNCTLHVHEVQFQDEGDWRCVVQAGEHHSQGPLLHLHINQPDSYNHEGTPLLDPEEDSVNTLVILLVVLCTILLVTVVLLFTRLYQRVHNSEETHKILQGSPRGSLDVACKTLPSTDLTAASVLAVEVRKKVSPSMHMDRYNQYLDMTGSNASGDGYIMMPGTGHRSSTSSRTTLSILSSQSDSRSRTASSSTTLSADFPHLMTLVDNPSYRASPHHPRPDSLYKSDHIYEEIKEKNIPEKMEKIPEVTTPVTPTYTNLQKDVDGYMIPTKTSSNEELTEKHSQGSPELPPPNPVQLLPADASNTKTLVPSHGQAAPYSRIGESGLVPASPTRQPATGPSPGYSRVGSFNPEERYDTPRSLPLNPIEGYDVPQKIPTELPLQPSHIPVSTDASVDVLSGTTV